MTGVYAPQGRWRIYTDAAAGPLLPEWVSCRVQVPRTGVGGFDLTYPADGPNADLLTGDLLAALGYEVMASDGSWSEPENCRFLPLRRTFNTETRTVTVSGAGIGWLTGKTVRWPMPWAENPDGKIEFTGETAGQIVQWFYYWAAVRRAIQNITIDWDAAADSDAQPWADTYTLEYDRGTTWRQVIDGFATDGLVWRFSGTTMQLAQHGFAAAPADVPILYDGVDVAIDRIEVGIEDAAGRVLAVGSGTAAGEAAITTLPVWGRWEVSQSHSGNANTTDLGRLASAELTRRGLSRPAATVTLLPSARYRPFDTVHPGQTVTVAAETDPVPVWRWDIDRWDSEIPWGSPPGWWQEITGRIEEIVVTDDGKQAQVSLAIGEQTATATDLLTRTVTAITGGRVARGTITGSA